MSNAAQPNQLNGSGLAEKSKILRQKGEDVSLEEALDLLPTMCGDLFIAPKRIAKIDRVGAGAFATVDICELKPADGQGQSTEVAVKRLRPECFPDKETVKDFIMEVMVMARLQHSCIVKTIGVGAFGGGLSSANPAKLYVVQELMPGGDLNSVLMRQCLKPRINIYTYGKALQWATEIARGLRYLHRSDPQVIHRDLKADNVLLTDPDLDEAQAKLTDFGLMVLAAKQSEFARSEILARELEQHEGKRVGALSMLASSRAERDAQRQDSNADVLSELPDHLTRLSIAPMRSTSLYNVAQLREGSKLAGLKGMLGSVPYIAPEIVKKLPYNEKVDIFAAGMLLYELFARKLITYDMITKKIWQDNARFIHVAAQQVADGFRPSFPPNFPAEIKPLVESCWSEDPKVRHSADELYHKLKLLEESGAMTKYDSMKAGRKLAQAKSAKGAKSGATPASQQKVEVVGCQCVIC